MLESELHQFRNDSAMTNPSSTEQFSLNAEQFTVGDDLAAHSGVPLIGVVTRLHSAVESRRTKFAVFGLTASVALLLLCYVGVLVALNISIYSRVGV